MEKIFFNFLLFYLLNAYVITYCQIIITRVIRSEINYNIFPNNGWWYAGFYTHLNSDILPFIVYNIYEFKFDEN